MASSARIDEIKKKFDENPRRYFAPLANEFRKAGDLEQAIMICEEFLPQQAGHMSGHIVYGQALFESGRLPESRTVFETALGLDPENLIALRHLGDIARSEGDLTGARRWYDRVLEADPRNEEIQGLIGSLDGSTGEPFAPAAAGHAPEASAASDADTLIVPAIPRPAASAAGAAPPPLEAIDLDLSDTDFAIPSDPAVGATHAPLGQPVVPPSVPEPDAPFESISLDGLEPTNAEASTASGMPEPSHARAEGLESAEFEAPSAAHSRAEGLEPLEFESPVSQPSRAEGLEVTSHEPVIAPSTDDTLLDLESSFELGGGSAASRASTVQPLAGLEESGAAAPAMPDISGLPMLDVDSGAPAASREHPHMEPPAAMEAMPALTADESGGPPEVRNEAGMMELPPAVIAAEAELMDAGDLLPIDAGPGSTSAESVTAGAPPFVTETMAELYLKQGFRDQALVVYRQLSAASPGDARLRDRLATLERGDADAVSGGASDGLTVREFFFRLATRQPGQAATEGTSSGSAFNAASATPPAPDDFASEFTSFEAIPEAPAALPSPTDFTASPYPEPEPETAPPREPEPQPEPEAELVPQPAPEPVPAPAAVTERLARPTPGAGVGAMPSAAERGATAQGDAPSGGTIDALFGTRGTSTSEDSAASALAQAFGGTSEAPAITGRPARAATGELSLDSVFRDGPARPSRVSQSFSFDQFFSDSAGTEPAPAARSTPASGAAAQGEPAERSADDVQQFNSWLQGLKQQ